jgi:putative mRNA 3-end processing factor
MLKGGPVAFYIQTVAKRKNDAVFLVGYQIEGTPGRELYEHRKCVIDGKLRKVKATVDRFDFSSHSGARELHEMVKGLKGNPKVYVDHGEDKNCKLLAEWVKKEAGLETVAPETGDTFTV